MNAVVTKETASNIPPLPIIEPAKAFKAPPAEPVLFFKCPNASTVAVILLPIPIIPYGASCAIRENCIKVFPPLATGFCILAKA